MGGTAHPRSSSLISFHPGAGPSFMFYPRTTGRGRPFSLTPAELRTPPVEAASSRFRAAQTRREGASTNATITEPGRPRGTSFVRTTGRGRPFSLTPAEFRTPPVEAASSRFRATQTRREGASTNATITEPGRPRGTSFVRNTGRGRPFSLTPAELRTLPVEAASSRFRAAQTRREGASTNAHRYFVNAATNAATVSVSRNQPAYWWIIA